MREIKGVRGSKEWAVPLVIGVDTVYIHSDIKEIETEHGIEYEYDEIQMTKEEYLQLIAEENNIKNANDIFNDATIKVALNQAIEGQSVLLFQNAMLNTELGVQKEINSNLLLRIANLEGGIA